jgi:hypothetical protein
MGWVAEIIDHRHAAGAPAGQARDEIGNAGVAFPPVLVRVLQAFANMADENRIGGIGNIPDLMP